MFNPSLDEPKRLTKEKRMKLRLLHRSRSNDADVDRHGDDTMRNSGKMSAESSSIDSSSYDTTENLTDTDTSSQIKSDSPRKRSSGEYNRIHFKPASTSNSSDADDAKRRVRFAMNAIETHDVESHSNFSSKERSKYWWSDREKDRMMAKHERLVAKYEQQRSGTKSSGSKKSGRSSVLQSYRGLESWTAAGSLKLDYMIEQCITAVMDEQDRQWNENEEDCETIAKKSIAVTEDSARRARLNGLQDAQEALRVRGELWGVKSDGDEMSVGSTVSTGTAAIVKKKKRKKLLARLDDSNKLSKSADKEDVLSSLKKPSKEKKKKKKKKSTKEKKEPKKTKDKGNSRSTADTEQAKLSIDTQDDLVSTAETVAQPPSGLVSSFLAGSPVPVSPLTQYDSNVGSDEYPLLATLRRQQQLLRKESLGLIDGSHLTTRSAIQTEDPDEDGDSVSPLLQTLRRQQRAQSSKWQHNHNDERSHGRRRTPGYPGSALQKCNSIREDISKVPSELTLADSSDPPGRRPRRIMSRHVETKSTDKKGKSERDRSKSRTRKSSRSRSRDKILPSRLDSTSHSVDSSSHSVVSLKPKVPDSNESIGSGAGKMRLDRLRNGAKTLFTKKSARK